MSVPADLLCVVVADRATQGCGALSLRALGTLTHSSVAEATGAAPWVGVGGVPGGKGRTERCYWEAAEALRVARLKWTEPTWAVYEDVILEAIVSASAEAGRLASVLDPVVSRQRKSTLIDTLEACFEERFEVQRVATRLRIHRHTVRYRIRVIEKLLGRSMRSGADRLTLQAALLARSLTTTRR